MSDGDAQRRVWSRLPAGAREAIDALSPTDLQTLLMSVAQSRAARVRPAVVLRRWQEDRFVRPAEADPRALAAVEARMWQHLPEEFDAVELSPVVPVGTCSAIAAVSQNRIVSTMRSVEVLSDTANALAVEAADRRVRRGDHEVHLTASHRLLRAQQFPPGYSQHFRLLTLVSSAPDTGSARTQARLLRLHFGYWRRVFADLAPAAQTRLAIFNVAVRERLAESAPDESVVPDHERREGYYIDAAFRFVAGDVELGDGGLTAWTAQLMGNAKERCLVSCASVERLAGLVHAS
jgi:hypothetical protein